MLAPTSTTLDPLSALTATKDAIASFTNNLTNTTTTTPHLSASPSDAGASIEQLHLAAGLINSKRSVDDDDTVVLLDGYRLSLGDVVAAARRHKKVRIDEQPAIKARIDESVEYLKSKLGLSVYGVTTGFGGSADTRTGDFLALQLSLLEHQLCGVLPNSFDSFSLGRGLENSLPLEVVRGAMLIRVNSLSRGHSAVRMSVLETIIAFLEQGITPVVPLRGTISASGDLSPLSYIAGAITGHPDIKVVTRIRGKEEVLFAPEALKLHGLEKVVLGPKEGLGLVNGTAVSSSMATLTLHDTHFLTLLSQALTALTVEAMLGQVGSFDPFIHDVTRPHPGQIQVASNIRAALDGSQFAVKHEAEVGVKEDEGVLRQDRYPLRTAAQWLGPLVSDLVTSHAALKIELNSTTDNPLIDVAGDAIHHGGNFQAMAVTNAMEKTRLGIQQIGKLNYAQMTEMVNCTMNRGLPSCLAAEDPSTSYHVKGLDIAAAAYCAELGHLSNPVNHVQPAEMSNQAVNSLALISARRTAEANDVLAMLLSTHLYCALQALDLRYIEEKFRSLFASEVTASISSSFSQFLNPGELANLSSKVVSALWRRLEQTTAVDLEPRWDDAFAFVTSTVIDALSATTSNSNPLPVLAAWRKQNVSAAVALMRRVREDFWTSTSSPTQGYLGKTRALYTFVREGLGVQARRGDVFLGKQEQTVGSGVSKIYDSIKDGRINEVLVSMFS